MNATSSTYIGAFRQPGRGTVLSAPMFNSSVATSALGSFAGQITQSIPMNNGRIAAVGGMFLSQKRNSLTPKQRLGTVAAWPQSGLFSMSSVSAFPSGMQYGAGHSGAVAGIWDDIWSSVQPAVTEIAKGAVQLGGTALANVKTNVQRKLGVTDSGKVWVNPQTGVAYPVVEQNGTLFLRDSAGNLTPYSGAAGYVTTPNALLSSAEKWAPWAIGAVALGIGAFLFFRKK